MANKITTKTVDSIITQLKTASIAVKNPWIVMTIFKFQSEIWYSRFNSSRSIEHNYN